MNEHDFDEGLKQVFVCTYGDDCARVTKERHGSASAIYDAIKAARNEAGKKRNLYVVRTSCQGWCEYAPVCAVMPGQRIFHDLDPKEAKDFVKCVLAGDEKPFKSRQIWDFSKTRDENYEAKKGGGAF